jgi:hypothetical protein
VLDVDGREQSTKTVSVNQPLRFGGVTAYQTDWSMSALKVRVAGSFVAPEDTAFQLPMAALNGEQVHLTACAWCRCHVVWCTAAGGLHCTESQGHLLLWHGRLQGPLFAALLERGCRLPQTLPSSSLALLPCRPFQVQRLALTVSPLPFLYPCPTLNAGGDSKLYATFLPAEDPALAPPGTAPRGVSILARDLQVHRCVLPACRLPPATCPPLALPAFLAC